MAAQRLSRRQYRILAWLAQEAQRTQGTMRASHQELIRTLAADKGNVSHSLKNLEAKGLIVITRTPGGKAAAIALTPAGRERMEVVNKGKKPRRKLRVPLDDETFDALQARAVREGRSAEEQIVITVRQVISTYACQNAPKQNRC